jgi:all-trans-retinol 13,14-reductase
MFGINNLEINLLFQVFSGMCGLPNDRVAALLTVGVIYSLREKAYRPRNSFSELPKKMEHRFQELGGEFLFRSEVNKILIEKGAVQGVRLTDGTIIRSHNVISTIDVKTTLDKLIGLDLLRAINPKYAGKIKSAEMTTSAFTVNLGIDDSAILTHARLPVGYSLLTSGNNAFQTLFSAFEKNEFKVSEDCFFIGLSCPPPQEREKPVLTIQSIPTPVSNWIDLRNMDRKRYIQEKEKTADLLINIVEKYLVPDLKQHIVVRDISTPATFARYSGSPGGSIYDMASVPSNFGASRLPLVTPIRGLLLPKFAHGAFGAMNSGLQAVDVLLNGKVMHGNSRFGRTK